MDVDYFKKYNDQYGHQAGDDCLKRIAKAIEEQLYRPADIVARYGGEEFTVLLPGTDLEGAFLVADRVIESVSIMNIPHAASDITDHVTISIGLATSCEDDLNSMTKIIKRADEALYTAKESGRNQYYPSTTQEN